MSIILLSLALVACGGGGTPSTPPPAPSAPNLQNVPNQTYTVGTSIASLIFTNSGGGSLTSCSANPALPRGLAVVVSGGTCVIRGTPTTPKASATYTITATNATGAGTGTNAGTVSITVNAAPRVPNLQNASAHTYTVGTVITPLILTNNGGGSITGCSANPPLPTGLAVAPSSDGSTCVISGAPTMGKAGDVYTITGTNVVGAGTGTNAGTVSITVNAAPRASNLQDITAEQVYTVNVMIIPLPFLNTGGAITGCAVAPPLPDGLTVDTSTRSPNTTCAISGTPTAVKAKSTYTITGTNTNSANSTGTVTITVNATLVVPNLQNITAEQVYPVGVAIDPLIFTNTGGDSITGCSANPALPVGLAVAPSSDGSTCVISGVSTMGKAGAVYTITGTNVVGAGTGTNAGTVSITVNTAPRTSNLQDITAEQVYTVNVMIIPLPFLNTGGAITGCAVAPALPAGLAVAVNAGTCRISGTPTAAKAKAAYTITGTNINSANSTGTVTITVNATLVVPNLQNITAAQVYPAGVAIAALSFTNTGGTSLTSCAASPALPTGLTVALSTHPPNTTCVISGTPTVAKASTTYTITGTNATGAGNGTNTATVDITVTALAVFGKITYDNVPTTNSLANTANCTPANASLCHGETMVFPVRLVTVELLDSSGSRVADTQTDASGNYRFNNPPDQSVRVRVRAELVQTPRTGLPSWNVIVQDNTNGNALYTLVEPSGALPSVTAERNLHARSGWNQNASSYTTTRAAAPFAILNTIYNATALGAIASFRPVGLFSANFPKLTVNWSINNTTTDGNPAIGNIGTSYHQDGQLYILGADGADTDEFDQHVIVHEWGHFFEYALSRSDSPEGAHNPGDRLDMTVAWSEGFSNALAGLFVTALYIDTLTPTTGFSFSLENNTHTNPGWYNEGSIGSILYDLYDGINDDPIDLTLTSLYNILVTEQKTTPFATSIFTFITALKADLPAEVSKINQLVNAQMISGTTINATGSTETNNAGKAADVLPIYTLLTVGGASTNLCTTTAFEPDPADGNKLSSARYISFTTTTAMDYQITATRTSTNYPSSAASDPVFDIISPRSGGIMSFRPTTGNQVIRLAASTQHAIRLRDEAVVDQSLQGDACFDIQITAN